MLMLRFDVKVVYFGTNLNRVFFLFSFLTKESFYIYNEIPFESKKSLVYLIDKFVFSYFNNVYVSSYERASYVRSFYGLKKHVGVLENCAFTAFSELPEVTFEEKCSALFSGSVSGKRFNGEIYPKFRKFFEILGCKIDVYGLNSSGDLRIFSEEISSKGSVTHNEMMEIMNRYKYGILSYYTGEVNYDLCAPIKLYEYISAGCIVVSMNKNLSLLNFASQYPNLIIFVDDIESSDLSKFDRNRYLQERNAFLSSGVQSNKEFSLKVLGSDFYFSSAS
jgi:hypothetical protein